MRLKKELMIALRNCLGRVLTSSENNDDQADIVFDALDLYRLVAQLLPNCS